MTDTDEKPKNETESVSRWQEEIELALNSQKAWVKEAKKTWKVYRSESTSDTPKDTFNILWANVEIKRQSIINSTPISDIRRRYGDDDPVGMNVCELLNRAVSYTLDCQEGLHKLILCANDFLVPSRAQVRVRYSDENDYEECKIEHVNWQEFFHGPGKEWDQVPWVGYEHCDVTKEDVVKQFGEDKAKKLQYTKLPENERKDDHDSDKSIYAKTTLYEIWDKATRSVYWLAKDYNDDFLQVVEDPLDLKNFFSCPRPAYAIEDPNSLIPIIEYGQYQTLAKELEDITRRLLQLVRACKVRGIYDSRITEIERLMQEDENSLVAAQNANSLEQSGGLEKAVWMWPIEMMVAAIQNLQVQRVAVKGMIDELNGMSDIVRGSTNPNETATAQRIKASFASSRLDKQKQMFQIFCRDLVRLIAEVCAGFSRETLSKMTGLKFITNEEKQAAQQRMQVLPQMAQQSGLNPEQLQQEMQKLQGIASQITWEDIEEVLKSDMEREYRIDIETDSTIAADAQADQQVYAQFMQGMAQFTTMAAQGMQVGLLSPEAAKSMLIAFARKFRLGKEVEEQLEKPLAPKGPDPEQQAMQAEMQMKQQDFQMKQQGEQQKQQYEMQKMQMEFKLEQDRDAMERQKMQDELQIERERLNLERERMAMEQQNMIMKAQHATAAHHEKMESLEKKDVA